LQQSCTKETTRLTAPESRQFLSTLLVCISNDLP
jgi:hypothetical protein